MRISDLVVFAAHAARAHRLRTALTLLAMAIGVAAVITLVSLGEGARRYVAGQFQSLGSHLLIVMPGRSETAGGPPPLLGETPRDLTLADAAALRRSRAVLRVAPIVVGSAPASWENRSREVTILGSTAELLPVRQLELAQGQFLPPGEEGRESAVCVLGSKLRSELFGSHAALGEWLRLGDRRFRVVGVLAPKGQSIGVDYSQVLIVPVAASQALFNTESLFRILVQAASHEAVAQAKAAILEIIRQRHDGEDDITVVTQDAVLSTFDRILTALTLAVAGIAAISLVVAGILVMNVMLVAVSQRRAEIGLLKSLGAPRRQIRRLFVAEAALLSLAGSACGLALAAASIWLLEWIFPDFPLAVPLWSLAAAVGTALGTGLAFGVLPALRAARLDPVEALSRR
jgi:putative ABC transport system permease protein